MSSIPDREIVDNEDLRPIQSGIGSIVENKRILAVTDTPSAAYALTAGTLRSAGPSFAGWLGSRAGAAGGATVGTFMAPGAGTAAGGFVGSTAGGAALSSFAQWVGEKVAPVGAKEMFGMHKYPVLTQVGGYLSATPYMRSSTLKEWSDDPTKTFRNFLGEVGSEFGGAVAIHGATGQKWKNFDVKGEAIGAVIEGLVQNEETKLGKTIAGAFGLGGQGVAPTISRPGQAPVSQRDLVAEATAGAPVAPPVAAPIATPGVTIPPVAATPGAPVPVITPGAPVSPAGTVPTAAGTVPPAATTVPPTAGTVPPVAVTPGAPVAATGTSEPSVIQSEDVEVDEEFVPVEPRPALGDPLLPEWDKLYGETHNPNGRPKTYVDPMPDPFNEARKDPAWNPAWENTPDRGTGLPPTAEPRPRVAPTIESTGSDSPYGMTWKDETAADILAGLQEEAKTNPQMAEYLKKNKIAVDQAIQRRLEWNKKYGNNYQPDGSIAPPSAMLDILTKYNSDEKLGAKMQSWVQSYEKTHLSDGSPKDTKRESRRLRESLEFRKAKLSRHMQNGFAGWRNEAGDVIVPKDQDGKRHYEVRLDGSKQTIKTRSIKGALDVIKNRKATTTQAQTATPTPTPTATTTTTATEAKDTKDTKDTTKPTSGPVEISNIDQIIANGGGKAVVTQGGTEVKFDKFGVSISDGQATVAYVEMADKTQAGKGIGKAAYIALGKALAARGITLRDSGSQLAPGRKLWLSLVRDGYAVRTAGGYLFVDKDATQAQTQAQPQPQAQPADTTGGVDAAAIAALLEKVPEYKWASPTGDAYTKFRMEVMKALGAEGVTKANSGVNNYRNLLINKLGINPKQTIAAIDKDIVKFLKKLLEGGGGSLDNDDSQGDASTVNTKPKETKPAGAKPAGSTTITKPITDDEKAKLREIVQNAEDDQEEDPDNRMDPNDELHPIFDDISERNNYADRKALAAELKAKLGAEFEGSVIQKSLKSWEAPTKPIEFKGVKTPIGNTGVSVAFGPSPTGSKKSRGVVIVFDEDGKAILVGNMDSYDGKSYNGPPDVGLFYNHGDAGFAGPGSEVLDANEIIKRYGKEKAAEIYAGYVDAVIKAARETLLREIKEKGKAKALQHERTQTILFNRSNDDPLDIENGDVRDDLINLILGLDGKESDAEYVAAVEKRFGVKFVAADDSYSSGDRTDKFSFDLLTPGLDPIKPESEPSKLNNQEAIIAAEYDELFSSVKDPSEEAQKLAAKLDKLSSGGAAHDRVGKELRALNKKHAKALFEKYKIYRPDDSRYVKGTKIPMLYPGQKDLKNLGDEIRYAIEEIYRQIPGGVVETGRDWGDAAFEIAGENTIIGDAVVDKNFAKKTAAERISAFDSEAGEALTKNQSLIDERNKILEKLSRKMDLDSVEGDLKRIQEIDKERFGLLTKVLKSVDKLATKRREMIENSRKEQAKAGFEFKLDDSGTVAVFDTGVATDKQFTKSPSQRRLEQIEAEARSKKKKDGNVDWDAHKLVTNKYAKEIKELLSQPSYVPFSQNIVIKSKDGTQIGSVTLSFETDLSEARRDEDDMSRMVRINVGQGSLTKDQAIKLIQVIGTRLELINRKNKEAYWKEFEDRKGELRGDSGDTQRILEAINEPVSAILLNKGASKEVVEAFKKTFARGGADKSNDGIVGSLDEFLGLSVMPQSKGDRDLFAAVSEKTVEDVKQQLADTTGVLVKEVDESFDEDIDEDERPKGISAEQFIGRLVKLAGEQGKGPGTSFDETRVMEIVQNIRDFKSGKMFGDKGAQQEAKPTAATKPTKPVATEAKPVATEAKPAAPAMDSVTAMAQEKPNDSASLKTARTKLRAVIEKLGSDSQQAVAMSKNIARAEEKQASFNKSAEGITKPYSNTPEPDSVTKARAQMAVGLKKGQVRGVAYKKAEEIVNQYESEHDLYTGTVTEDGIRRVSNKVLEDFLQRAQDAINAAGGITKAGETLKGELGLMFNMAQDEFQRRMQESERKDEYGDLLADIAGIIQTSNGSIAVPTLPKALKSSYSEMSEMFDSKFTTGKNSILRQPMHGIDVQRYLTDKEYKKQVNNTAEAMLESLAERLDELGWAQFNPRNFSSNELMDALYEAGMGRPLVPKSGVMGASWKGDVGNVANVANTDTATMPQDLFQASEKPKQLGAKKSNDLIDEADTFSLSGETAATAPTQTVTDDKTQDLAPDTQEPAYIAQARTQLSKLEKAGASPAQQRTLRDTIEQYEATLKQAQPKPEATQQADKAFSQELKDQFDDLVTEAESTMNDLESTAGGTAASDKEVNGKKGIIAMAREAIQRADPRGREAINKAGYSGPVSHQEASDMLRAASTKAVDLLESHQEKASNIEDMGREDPFAEREDMIDQLQDLANQLDILADIIDEGAGAQAEGGEPAVKMTRKDIDREIQRLRDEQKKEMDAVLDSNMPYRETNDALTALSKKYEPQFKKLMGELKKLTKNDPGAMSVEGAIGRDGEFARFVTGLKKKLDAGTITQAEYDEAYARIEKAGRVERSTDDADSAKNEEVPKEGGKTTIKGKNIAMPLPDSITNQDKKDSVVLLVMTEIRNQIRNSQNGIGTSKYLGDMRKIKGAEAFVFEKIKAFLDKNPSASYLQVVANLYQVSLPNSTKSLKGKLADAQELNAILMDAYRTAVANLRLSQIANGVPESEVVSDDILGHRNKDLSGMNVMTQIGLADDIVRYLNSEDAPYDTRQKDGKKGKPKDDAQYLRGNTAYNIEKTFDEIVDKLIKTGKHTTTTSLLDAVVAELETQVKQLDTDIQNEILTKIKAFVNSRKGDQPFSRFDRQADDNDKARELDTRVARNSQNRQGDPDARKGFTGMISRALDELRLRGEITAKEAESLTRIMNYIGSQFFSGEKMSIKNDSERGYYGMYSFGDKVLTIFRDAMRDGRFTYTAAHEIAHLLTKYLPDKDRKDLINEWRTARMKFLKDNPGIAAILKDPYADFNSIHFSSLEIQKAESIQPGVTKAFVKKELQVGLRGKTKTVYVVAAHEGVYQVFNADEYFAENFVRVVMKRLNSDPAYTGNPKTWREKLASLWDMIKTGFRQMFGKDVTARILADFAKGRISPDMKGNYGLTDLHNAMPSKGDRKVGIDAMARDKRMGQNAFVVTEQSERQLRENLIKAADKSMTIKDAIHMVLRGVTGPKADLIRLLTDKVDKDYSVQFSSKTYLDLHGAGRKTSEGRDIPGEKVLGVHVAGGDFIRVFLPSITKKHAGLNGSLADVVAYVLTHEIIHSYTQGVINENSLLRNQAQTLVDEIKEELLLTMTEKEIQDEFYGLTSPAELMTECLLDPKLRDIANSIQSKAKSLSELKGETVLDKIISVFQNALESVGIKVNRNSVLDRMSEIIAVERDIAGRQRRGGKYHMAYVFRGDARKVSNFVGTEDYSYSPDSPTATRLRTDLTQGKKNRMEENERARAIAAKYRESGEHSTAEEIEMEAANEQSRFEEWVRETEGRINGGITLMLEQAIPDLRKIDGNDTPSARETLLGIRDDVMPSIGPAHRPPTRKNEEKNIAQIAWDVVSGRYFSGLSAKAHQNAERHDYSETVKQVANMIHSRPGVNSSTSERDIPTAMMTSRIRFQNKFNTIVDPLKGMLSGFKDSNAGTAKEQREVVYRALHDMIRGEKPITKGKLGEVATNLKKLFEELREYRVGAGEQLGDVKDYFPAVYDSPRIAQERDAFTRDASEAYKITIQDLANSDIYLKKMSKMDSKYLAKMLGVTEDEVEAGVTEKGASIADLMQQKAVDQANAALAKELGISKEEVEDGASKAGVSIDQLILERSAARANELFQTHLRGMGSSEFDSIFGNQTGSEQENSNLKRVFAAEAQKVMSKWQVADPFRVVTSYITSSVKKAEVVRKFGAEGEIWKQYSEQMEADGVPYETIAEMRELVRVASGYGIPPKGKAAQTYVDSITMMTAASAMGRGFLNNLVEPVTMGIRAGNPLMAARGLLETWTRFVREIASLSPALKAKFGETFWSEYGKEIGTIHSSIEDAWMATHSMDLDADRADPRFRWITNRIYQANLMDASETAKQQASHAIGYSYILGLAKLKKGKSWMNKLGMDPAQSTTDQLNELGIPEEDHGRFADYVMGLEKKNDIDKMRAMTDRSEDNDLAKMHQEAMVRFSYQSSVRSNRAHKPIFQDDLFGKTVLQLMNFSYSFAAEVNTRIFSMTKQAFMPSPDGKNYNLADRARMAAPLLSGFMAIVAYKMLFSIKDELYPTEGTEKRKKDPEFLKWVNATSYAGFLGPKVEQLIKIIKRDQAPGGPVGQSLVNVARAATTAAESLAQGKDMTAARRQASKAAIPIIKGSLNAGASAINPILGAVTTQATNTTGWANEFTKDETKANKGIGDALFAKPIKNKPIEK